MSDPTRAGTGSLRDSIGLRTLPPLRTGEECSSLKDPPTGGWPGPRPGSDTGTTASPTPPPPSVATGGVTPALSTRLKGAMLRLSDPNSRTLSRNNSFSSSFLANASSYSNKWSQFILHRILYFSFSSLTRSLSSLTSAASSSSLSR